jgi:hypothetical protein
MPAPLEAVEYTFLDSLLHLVVTGTEGAKFRYTPSVCGGDRDFADFASLFS